MKVPVYKDGNVISTDGYWDHLSFHRDGKIHIRTKSNGKRKEYIHKDNIGHSLYDFPDGKIIPLLTTTYNLHADGHTFKKMTEEESRSESNTFMWKIDKSMLFTMLIFLANINNYSSFHEEYIKQKLGITSPPMIIDMGDSKHCLLVLITSKIPVEYKNGYMRKRKQLRKVNEKNVNYSLVGGFRVLPSSDFLENGLVKQ